MEPFKNLLSPDVVRAAGRALAKQASPLYRFDRQAFERLALDGLEDLEMKARAMHIASALEQSLPSNFAQACSLVESALAPPVPVEGVASNATVEGLGLAGWIVWPLGEYVARRGIDEPERALEALRQLTQRLTAEYAIRPFIVRHPTLVLNTLQRWTTDPSEHVRRLCSEGSRPRLPWGLRLQSLVADPKPTLPILAALQDDPSAYVRRSVANHLNDIAKDHPDTVVAWVKKYLPGATAERRALLSHASRSLIKDGNGSMLSLWGVGATFEGDIRLEISPGSICVGEQVEINLELLSTSAKSQTLLVDYAVHHVKADGSTRPKVFKGWKLELAAKERRVLTKRHSFKPVTTRQYYAGKHKIEIMINGQMAKSAIVMLDCKD